MFSGQDLYDRVSAVFGQLHIGIKGADVVRMADDIYTQCAVVLKELSDFRDSSVGFRLNLGLPGVEVYAVYRNVACSIDVIAHCLCIGRYLLLHDLFFHDRKLIRGVSRFYGNPCFFVSLLDHDGRRPIDAPLAGNINEDLAADILECIFDVSDDLEVPRLGGAAVEIISDIVLVALDVHRHLFLVMATFGMAIAEKDRPGSKDHPLLTRMPNFHITDYKDTEFDSFKFIVEQNKKSVQVNVEGHKYYIRYDLDKGAAKPGNLKIVRNIENALKNIGGKVLVDVAGQWGVFRSSTIMVQKGGKETWIAVKAADASYELTIVEKGAMEQEVVADAAAMGNDINATGHAAVYGIYFDTGKSTIKPESDAAIAEIAKLLNKNSSMKIYVVGHTDNIGSFDANMKLSKDRADAVLKTLVSNHHIAAARLKAVGIGQAAPVASNKTEDGKAKNRRVELVEQ